MQLRTRITVVLLLFAAVLLSGCELAGLDAAGLGLDADGMAAGVLEEGALDLSPAEEGALRRMGYSVEDAEELRLPLLGTTFTTELEADESAFGRLRAGERIYAEVKHGWQTRTGWLIKGRGNVSYFNDGTSNVLRSERVGDRIFHEAIRDGHRIPLARTTLENGGRGYEFSLWVPSQDSYEAVVYGVRSASGTSVDLYSTVDHRHIGTLTVDGPRYVASSKLAPLPGLSVSIARGLEVRRLPPGKDVLALILGVHVAHGTPPSAHHPPARRHFIGVFLAPAPEYGASGENADGALVTGVQPGSSAAYAGLMPGDVIHIVNGDRVRSPEDVAAAVARTPIGQKVSLAFLRRDAPGWADVVVEGDQTNPPPAVSFYSRPAPGGGTIYGYAPAPYQGGWQPTYRHGPVPYNAPRAPFYGPPAWGFRYDMDHR